MTHPSPERAREAADSHGVITAAGLRRRGWSRTMIAGAVRRGALFTTPFTGVFTVGTPSRTAHQRAMAAVRATDGLLSHAWCRWLFGVGGLPGHPPDVTVTGNRRGRTGLTLHRTRGPLTADANHGIPCTRPERMVVDCAPTVEAQDLRRLVNDVQIKRLATFAALTSAVRATRGRPTQALRALLAVEPRGATRSLLEDLLLELARERGLPAPAVNAIVDGEEVDFSYYDGALVIEADGYGFHGTKVAFERDREKRLGLEARGRRVLWVSYRQVTELRRRTMDDLEAIIRVPHPISSRATPSAATSPGAAPV